MPQTVTSSQIQAMQHAVQVGGAAAAANAYGGLYAQGYNYAGWAEGVARGDSFAGNAALKYMQETAIMGLGGDACRILSQAQIDQIRTDMAERTLAEYKRIADANGGELNRDLTYQETKDIHVDVFEKNGLDIKNWTLDTPMEVIRERSGDEAVERLWKELRDTGGDGADAFEINQRLMALMDFYRDQLPETRDRIDDWSQHFDDLSEKWDIAIDTWTKNIKDWPNDISDWWDRAKNWVWPRDPIILDLDGDGLELVGLAGRVHFDHDGDGIRTGTGWAGKDDGLLVWDRNANGRIDTGAELFGDFTPLLGAPEGTLAPNGFAALAALDANGDGVLDASDPAFAELKLWRDASQDGISQGGEFITLAEAGIVSLNLANTLKNQNFANGNQLTREGSFTRTDGSTAGMGEFRLASDTFDTEFADEIEVPDALKALPTISGAGNVRELQQAATLSAELRGLVEQFTVAPTRAAQKNVLDELIQAWAGSAGTVKSSTGWQNGETISLSNSFHWRTDTIEQLFGSQLDAQGYDWRALVQEGSVTNAKQTALVEMLKEAGLIKGSRYAASGGNIQTPPTLEVWRKSAVDAYHESSELGRRIAVLERFNGSPGLDRFVVQQSWNSLHGITSWMVNLPAPAAVMFNAAYDSLKDSVYANLVLQTRLKPYLDQIEIVIDDNGIRLDASRLNQALADKRATDPENALADLLDLDRYAGSYLAGTNWGGLADFDQLIDTLPQTDAITTLLDEFKVSRLTADKDDKWLTDKADIVLAGDGNDDLYSQGGNDRLFGQGGDDRLFGGSGDDLLSGGAGNDTLMGDSGADTYVFGRQYGNDTIIDHAEGGIQRDTVRLLGLTPADLKLTADYQDNLLFTIIGTGETLSVPNGGYWWGKNGVGKYVFDDGTVWTHEDALRATVAATSANDDLIHGSSAGDTITGQAGHDTLIGNAGNDVIDGGAGDDVLIGSTGWHWILENGQYRAERNSTPTTSANGSDTYLFGLGDGQDTVIDGDTTAGNSDTLRFKEGVARADVKLVRSGNDLVLEIRGSSDQVTLKQYFDEAWSGAAGAHLIERIAFADGTVLSLADVQATLFAGTDEADTIMGSSAADVLTGRGGDDVLLGSAGRDILDGGAGNDVLRGGGAIGWGNQVYDGDGAGDTYRFGRGDGHDSIIDSSWQEGETDRIAFKAGVLPSDVLIERVRSVNGWQLSDDLQITIRDTGETLTVKNHFDESKQFAVEEIAFADGTVWNAETIKSHSLLGGAGNDELRGFDERDDVMVGGAGNDTLSGLSGSDTYRFGLGDGHDVIKEGAIAGEDVVQLAAGVTPADVTVRWTVQGDMAITLADGSKLTVRGQPDVVSTERGIEQVRFADGTVWNRSELAARAVAVSDGDDAIVGGYQDDTFDGGAGADSFRNLGGYDTYQFGSGDGQDVIDAGTGRLLFKPGIGQNDVSFTREGNDLIATVTANGDAVRVKDWLSSWQRLDRFDFDNGASLSVNDVMAHLNVGAGDELLFGSAGDDVLAGTEKDSGLYGRDGNDQLEGGAGRDQLHGEAGDDVLDGGADQDWLYGGEGSNSYHVSAGMGLDHAMSAGLAVARDTVLFAPGIKPADVSVQLGDASSVSQAGDVGYYTLVIGIGGNDALVLRAYNWDDLGRGALQQFRFDDGTEWTLADVIARADGGKLGWQQRGWGDANTIVGSQAEDEIADYTNDSVTVRARGNNDDVRLQAGNDRVSAGSGEDNVSTGWGDDLIAGEAGDDSLTSGAGDDVLVFNYGDGKDNLRTDEGVDTLSFGAAVTPGMLSAALDRDGKVVLLVDGGGGGSLTLDNTDINNLPGDLERIQFIDADGKTRVFDLGGWLQANAGALLSATLEAPLAVDGAPFELTGTVAPAGGLEAVAYAQSGDLFASASLANNVPSAGDDVLYGTEEGETLEAGTGNDLALGLGGDDLIFGGEGADVIHGGDGDDVLEGNAGNDVIHGGWGADQLSGGTGNNRLFGEWGGDTYLYQSGQGEVIIDDDHRVLHWGHSGEGEYGGELSSVEGDAGRHAIQLVAAEPGYGGAIVDDALNILSFGAGIRPEDLRYSQQNGDLVIELANQPGDRIILRGYAPDRATQTRSVDIFRFADGFEIVAAGIEVTGETRMTGDDGGWLDGTPLADTLIGGAGDDTLGGQGGADRLVGGTGSDTYRVHKNWSAGPTQTLIAETWRGQDVNRIEITGDIYADELRLEFDGSDLLLRLTADGDTIRFAGFDPRAAGMPSPVSEISLPWWGVSVTFDDLLARGVRILGTPEEDVLTGSALADWIAGRGADDSMSGGAGGDFYIIDADAGTDTIIDHESGAAPNTLVLPDGTTFDDVRLSYDAEGFLILDLGNTGNRVRLSGFDPQDPLALRAVERFRFGMEGVEIGYEELLSRGMDIVGTEESDTLKGSTLADRVRGGDGNDLIEATPGGDRLAGEGGNDTYVVQRGDGIVTIDDVAAENAGNVLRFGAGIDPDALRNNLRFDTDGNGGHVLLIAYGDAGDVVRLSEFDPLNVLGQHAIERFEFANGTAVDYATLASWTFVVEGDNLGNALQGTNLGDRLYGYNDDDVLSSGAGDDVLTGGFGNDVLRGGAGRDAYVVNLGDGADVIEDALDAAVGNVLTFGAGITRADVRLEVAGSDLLIRYGINGDMVRVSNYAPADGQGGTVIDTFEFADGTAVTLREFMNRAPDVASPVSDQSVLEDAAFRLALPDNLFIDTEGDAILTRVTVSGFEGAPEWLQYDAATRTLYGTPDNATVGQHYVSVQGTDTLGATSLHGFHVTVQNTNDAPQTGVAMGNQQAAEDTLFHFTVPANAFRDVDSGDALSYSAVLQNGDPLPSWLSFDKHARAFSGTPANGDVGTLQVRVTATDLAGVQASQAFQLSVANTNDAPEIAFAVTKQQAKENALFAFTVPQDAFRDIDAGDTLTLSAARADGTALPAWLKFDAATRTFSGTPTHADVGSNAVRLTATDAAGAQVSQTFDLAVEAGGDNEAPVTTPDAANVIEDRKLLAWGNVLANDRDPEGEQMRVADPGIRRGEYGVLTLLSTGSYAYVLDNCSAKVQGLGANEKVTETFSYLASDGTQRSTGALTVTVQGSNDAPHIARSLADVQLAKGKTFSWRMAAGSFVDADRNDTLSYTATLSNGKALPSWLKFDAATQSFSGTAPANAKGSIDVRVTASDGHGECASASDDFKISVGNKTVLPAAPKGNEGVGNGADAPPPGHGANLNDGAGTAPGQPGRKQAAGRDDSLERFLDGYKRDDNSGQSSYPALPALDRRWFEQWGGQQGEQLHASGTAGQATASHDVARHWAELTHALNRLDAERQSAPGWSHVSQGADLSGLAGAMQGGAHAAGRGVDAVSLTGGAGTHLKGFSGIQEGVGKLSW